MSHYNPPPPRKMWTDIPRVSDALQVLQDPVTAGTAEKELVAQEGLGTGKGIPKAGTSGFARGGREGGMGGSGATGDQTLVAAGPRSVPARRKLQAAPPLKPPPPPPPPRDDLPWGDLTLNKCLVLASLVALLGSAVQLCQGERCRGGIDLLQG